MRFKVVKGFTAFIGLVLLYKPTIALIPLYRKIKAMIEKTTYPSMAVPLKVATRQIKTIPFLKLPKVLQTPNASVGQL